jgi:hypothetical protein
MMMLRTLFLFCLVSISAQTLWAQEIYTIKADSTKLTGCDSNELIIENHTQAVKGFLYNTGNGRTIFKPGIVKINDSLYIIGADSLKYNAWLQGGNKWGKTGILGSFDNNHVGLYTNSLERLRITNTGKVLIGTTTDNGYDNLQVSGSIYNNFFTNISPSTITGSGAIRLRWGTSDGTYMAFHFQNKTTRRTAIKTESDDRPFIIEDSVGVSFRFTPKVMIGSEWGFNDAKFSIVRPYTATGLDIMSAGRSLTDTTTSKDFVIKASGHVLIGGGSDAGYPLQVTGTSQMLNIGQTLTGSTAGNTINVTADWRTTASNTALKMAVTDSLSNSGTNYLVDLQSAGISRLKIPTNSAVFTGYPNGLMLRTYTGGTGGISLNAVTPIQNTMVVGGGFNLGESDGLTSAADAMKFTSAAISHTTGEVNLIRSYGQFQPSGGTGTFNMLNLNSTLNQLSGASGVTRGLYINPVLQSAADFHAIEVVTGKSVFNDAVNITGTNGYSQLRLVTHYTPTSSTDSNGSAGDTAVDDNYFYYKTSTGWKRAALTTW